MDFCIYLRVAIALLGGAIFVCSATGQILPNKTLPTPSITPSPQPAEDALKISTSLVDIPVSVFDKDRFFVPGLTNEDFQIFENGVLQKTEYFADTEQPFTVVLLLDLSGSMQRNIQEIKAACLAFIDKLKPNDKITVITFNEEIRVLNRDMTDREALRKEIKKLSAPQLGTLLYPAVETVSARFMSRINGRKALILFTDGIDMTRTMIGGVEPRSNYRTSLQEAVKSSSLVFCVQYTNESPATANQSQLLKYVANDYLDDLAKLTGGRVFSGGLSRSFLSVAEELRHRYSIGYYPELPAKRNEIRKIEVKLNQPGFMINAREFYIGR